VLGAAYAWYNLSGTKAVVDTAADAIKAAQEVKETVSEYTPSPKATKDFVGSVVKSYAKSIPGVGPFVEQAWAQLEELSNEHGDEVEHIITDTYYQLKKLTTDKNAKLDAKTGDKALQIIQKAIDKASELAPKLGNEILDKNPEIRDAFKSQLDDLEELVKNNGGPEAKQLLEETYSKIKDTISSKGVSPTSVATIASLLANKLSEAKEIANEAGSAASSAAWEAAAKAAGPALKKMPEIKDLLDEHSTIIKTVAGAGGAKLVKEIYDQVQSVADSGFDKKSVEKLTTFIKDKVAEASSSSEGGKKVGGKILEMAQSKFDVSSIPGADKLFDNIPSFATLQTLVKEHGPEVEHLMEETYTEIEEVLVKKVDEAKKIVDAGKKDVKKDLKKDSKKSEKKDEKKEKK